MSDLGLRIKVREHKDDGTPESTWPPIEGAVVQIKGGKKIDDGTVVEMTTGTDGGVEIRDFLVSVKKDGYSPYVGAYVAPSLQAPELPVSLQRL